MLHFGMLLKIFNTGCLNYSVANGSSLNFSYEKFYLIKDGFLYNIFGDIGWLIKVTVLERTPQASYGLVRSLHVLNISEYFVRSFQYEINLVIEATFSKSQHSDIFIFIFRYITRNSVFWTGLSKGGRPIYFSTYANFIIYKMSFKRNEWKG